MNSRNIAKVIQQNFIRMEARDENYFSGHAEKASILEPMEISNIEFTNNGENLAYTTGDSLKIYSASTYTLRNVISTSIDQVMKFFQDNTLLHTKDSSILYLSIYDNKYLRRFEGHSSRIHGIFVDSSKDTFMSLCSEVANIWDIRMRNPIKRLKIDNHIGCIGSNDNYFICDSNYIRVFDMRSDFGPVYTREIPPSYYRKGWFTNDNGYIILAGMKCYAVLDGEGAFQSFIGMENDSDGSTTAGSDTLLCASKKMVYAYRVNDRTRIGSLETPGHENYAVKSNPCSSQFVCVSSNDLRFYDVSPEK